MSKIHTVGGGSCMVCTKVFKVGDETLPSGDSGRRRHVDCIPKGKLLRVPPEIASLRLERAARSKPRRKAIGRNQ